jgi:signal transduction histidine kinase
MGERLDILLVEDDGEQAAFVAASLQHGLARHDVACEIHSCGLLADALAALDGKDIVLLDLGLPDSEGLIGLQHVLAADEPPPVVVLTGRDDMRLAIQAVQHGAQDYVLKQDIGTGALIKALLYSVERHRLKAELAAQAARLERSEASFRGIANNADGLLILDDRRIIRWANDAAAGLFGAAGDSGHDLVGQRFAHPVAVDRESEIEHGGRVLQMRVVETVWDDGSALLASVRDVTDRAAAERGLMRAQKISLLGQLTGSVAHDFSNVLTGLMGNADMLLEACAAEPVARTHAEAVVRDLAYAARLTEQLRSLGRQQVVAPEPTQLNLVVERAGPLLEGLVGEELELHLDLGFSLPEVMADPAELERALLNRVSNARQASARGGNIRIATRAADAGVELLVEDEGRGMDAATVARATEPFFSALPDEHGQTTMGLGLTMVRDIVQRCDGDLHISSTPGVGTCVRLSFPAATDLEASIRRTGEHRRAVRATETLLVVDDEGVIRDVLRRALERRGYTVLVAASGPAAIDRVLGYAGPLDLLITDVMMPEMNGRELAETLGRIRPGLPTLFISGYEERIVAPTGVLDGRTAFLAKPFRMEAVLDEVRRILDVANEERIAPIGPRSPLDSSPTP